MIEEWELEIVGQVKTATHVKKKHGLLRFGVE